MSLPLSINSPNILMYSVYELTIVGSRIGPFTVGPTTAAPMGPAVAGKKDWSISFVNTPVSYTHLTLPTSG